MRQPGPTSGAAPLKNPPPPPPPLIESIFNNIVWRSFTCVLNYAWRGLNKQRISIALADFSKKVEGGFDPVGKWARSKPGGGGRSYLSLQVHAVFQQQLQDIHVTVLAGSLHSCVTSTLPIHLRGGEEIFMSLVAKGRLHKGKQGPADGG